MSLSKEEDFTIEDIYALPEGQRAELVKGQLYKMAPPGRLHQDLAGRLYGTILNYINAHNGTCRPYIAPFAVFLNENTSYVEPDISVICDLNKLDDHGCHGAPDLIIEVVSPGSKRMDYYTKLVLYRDAGVKEYWIADPAKETVLVYLMAENEAPTIYRFTDPVPAGILKGLNICIKELL